MGPKTPEEIKASFQAFANPKTKRITQKSLKKWCKKNKTSAAHIDSFIKKMDENGDHEVDWNEFAKYYMLEEIKEAFKDYDLDGDGNVTKKELAQVLTEIGFKEDTVMQKALSIMQDIDNDSDGSISFDEFAKHFITTNFDFNEF